MQSPGAAISVKAVRLSIRNDAPARKLFTRRRSRINRNFPPAFGTTLRGLTTQGLLCSATIALAASISLTCSSTNPSCVYADGWFGECEDGAEPFGPHSI
jgi:hypothetical protein